MVFAPAKEKTLWRLLIVGGHTRSIGKTQLVCDIIRAFPRTEWIAGKITQYGHGVCARNGENCDCAPSEHACALDWETRADTGTDSARFLEAGAKRSFWLRTKQGYLAEGLPLLREALEEAASGPSREMLGVNEWPLAKAAPGKRVAREDEQQLLAGKKDGRRLAAQGKLAFGRREQQSAIGDQNATRENMALIVESNSLMQFVKPSLYFAVIDPLKEDFKQSAQIALDRAQALVLRGNLGEEPPAALWMKLPAQLMREKPSVLQREGEGLPEPLWELVHRMMEAPPSASL